MYDRRNVSALLRSSLSAPALGSAYPALPLRVWYTKTPVEPHSGSSSPTTSLLLHMWGYDQAHAPPPSSGRGGDCPDLLLDGEEGTPQWLGITSDQSFFRKVTGLVFGLAVLACCTAIMISAGGRLRPRELVDERAWANSTEPMISPMRDRPHMHFDVKTGSAATPAPTSAPGAAGPLLPVGNNRRMPEEKNLSVVAVGSAAPNGLSGRLLNPVYFAGETGERRFHSEDRGASMRRTAQGAPGGRLENGKSSDMTPRWPFRGP